MNQRPQDVWGAPLQLGDPWALYIQAPDSPALCLGSWQACSFTASSNRWAAGRVSVGANCLCGLALVTYSASQQAAPQLGEPDRQRRWFQVLLPCLLLLWPEARAFCRVGLPEPRPCVPGATWTLCCQGLGMGELPSEWKRRRSLCARIRACFAS